MNNQPNRTQQPYFEDGKRYEKARVYAGLSEQQARKYLGFPLGILSQLEDGVFPATVPQLKIMAKIYHVRLSWLSGEKDTSDIHNTLLEQIKHTISDSTDQSKIIEILMMLPVKD